MTTWLLETLPLPLRTALVHGSEGAGHLASCADMAAAAGLSALAGELALAAWAESPLDAALAARAAAVAGASPDSRDLASHVAANTAAPADLAYYRRLTERRDAPKIARYLEAQSAREPGNLFWTRLAMTHAMDDEDWGRVEALAAALPEPLSRLVGGDAAMCRGDAAAALARYSRLARLGQVPGLEARLGLAHLAAGDLDGARSWLVASLSAEPWRVRALLALHDLAWGPRSLRRMPEGPVSILLYTFNKAPDLARTLESLFATDLGQATVTVLDNGSTDGTPALLAAWRERSAGRLSAVTLPVNVGAPAARNWLMSLPRVRASAWVAFLDDDVELPRDWLGHLGAAAALYPEAGVWGARVVDHSRPAHVQSADVFLVPRDGQAGRRFDLSSCHHQTLDRGQFACLRPCATVTGCCHLFRAERLFAAGGFDLRYSPSQYDDLDHDIRLLLSGRPAVCQGHLAVRHFKSTGSQGGAGQAQYGLGFANQYKLHARFSPEEIARAARTADEAAWQDALAKWRAFLPEGGAGRATGHPL